MGISKNDVMKTMELNIEEVEKINKGCKNFLWVNSS